MSKKKVIAIVVASMTAITGLLCAVVYLFQDNYKLKNAKRELYWTIHSLKKKADRIAHGIDNIWTACMSDRYIADHTFFTEDDKLSDIQYAVRIANGGSPEKTERSNSDD